MSGQSGNKSKSSERMFLRNTVRFEVLSAICGKVEEGLLVVRPGVLLDVTRGAGALAGTRPDLVRESNVVDWVDAIAAS